MPDAELQGMRFINAFAKVWWCYASFILFVVAEVLAIYMLYRWLGLLG